MAETAKIIISIDDRTQRSLNEIEQNIANVTGKVTKKMKNQFDEISKGFKLIGAGMTAVGVAGSMAVKSIINTAANFEKSMSTVAAITQATKSDLEALTETAKMLGQQTVFTASEVAEAMKFLGMAGFDTEEILASVASTLDLAAAAQIELGRAADIASNVLTGFQLDASESQRVVDVLAATVTSANTDLEQMGDAMKYLAPTAAAFNVSLEESAAAVGLLGNAGIQGSLSTRAFGTSLTRLAKPTNQMIDYMQNLDLVVGQAMGPETQSKFFDMEGQFIGLANMVQVLDEAFEGLTEQQKQGAIAALFGAEAIQEINVLMAAGADEIRAYTKELEESGGVASEMADTQLDNLMGSITLLKSAFEGLQINIGGPFLDALRAVVDRITGLISFLNGLPAPIQKAIGVFLALGSALALVGGGIALIIGFKSVIISSFAAISAAVTASVGVVVPMIASIGAPILVLMALTAVLVAILVKNWETIKESTIMIFDSIKSYFSQVWSSIQSLFELALFLLDFLIVGTFTAIKEFIFEILGSIKEFFTTILQEISNTIMGWLTNILTGFKNTWGGIKAFVISTWSELLASVESFFGSLKETIMSFVEPIKGAFGNMFDGAKNVVMGSLENIKSAVKQSLNFIINLINKVIGGVNKVTGAASKLGVDIPSIPSIPQLAEGGIVTKPTLAMVGEGGEPEAVIPLSKLGAMGGGGTHYHFHDSIISSKEAAMEILDAATQEFGMSTKMV